MACSSPSPPPPLSLALCFLLSLSLSLATSASASASFFDHHKGPRSAASRCHHGPPPAAFFTFPSFDQLSQQPDLLSLFGDAHLLPPSAPHGLSRLQTSGSAPRTAGGFSLPHPLRLLTTHPSSSSSSAIPMSFFTSFSFSMDSDNGDGLAFFISPSNPALNDHFHHGPSFGLGLAPSSSSDDDDESGIPLSLPPHTLVVEFDTSKDAQAQDPSDRHVGLDIESLVSLTTADISEGFSSGSDSGSRLFAWIDYIAPRKALEVRLSRSEKRPDVPIISYNIDLSDLWQEEVYVGLSSSTGDAPQKHVIYSWTFVVVDTSMPRGSKNVPDSGGPGEWHHHGPRDWHHGPHDWHHGPHDDKDGFPNWRPHGPHHGPRNRDGFPHEPRDWHHGPHDSDQEDGFPHWQPHDQPDEWHPDHHHHHHHHDDDDHHHHHRHRNDDGPDSWLGADMDELWSVALSLLFGAACGTLVAGIVFLVWTLVRHRRDQEQEYQHFELDSKVKTSNGYEKLPMQEESC